jgi:uncharacterized membrane protein
MKAIKSYTQLHELQQELRKFDIYHTHEKYRLKLPYLNDDENIRITRVLNNYNSKGCYKVRNIFIAITLLTYIAFYFFSGGNFSAMDWSDMVWLFILIVVANIAGTFAGLYYARLRMIRYISKLLRQASMLYVNKTSALYDA